MVSKQQLVKFEAYLACSGDKDVLDISNLLFKIAAQPNDKRKVELLWCACENRQSRGINFR